MKQGQNKNTLSTKKMVFTTVAPRYLDRTCTEYEIFLLGTATSGKLGDINEESMRQREKSRLYSECPADKLKFSPFCFYSSAEANIMEKSAFSFDSPVTSVHAGEACTFFVTGTYF